MPKRHRGLQEAGNASLISSTAIGERGERLEQLLGVESRRHDPVKHRRALSIVPHRMNRIGRHGDGISGPHVPELATQAKDHLSRQQLEVLRLQGVIVRGWLIRARSIGHLHLQELALSFPADAKQFVRHTSLGIVDGLAWCRHNDLRRIHSTPNHIAQIGSPNR